MSSRSVRWRVSVLAAMLALLPIVGRAAESLWMMLASYCLASGVGLVVAVRQKDWVPGLGGILAMAGPAAFLLVDRIWHHVPPIFLEGPTLVISPLGVATVVIWLWVGGRR